MNTRIQDGTGKYVTFNHSAIKRAVLGDTNIAYLQSWESMSISFFESDEGNEVDVYDPRLPGGMAQTIYEPEDIDTAVTHFIRIASEVEDE